jgi:F-type H+-transporting ATPase subunit gamma
MASLKETKGRIASVKSTLKITSAMKMVASAKLHKAQNAIANMTPYERKLREMLQLLLATIPAEKRQVPAPENRATLGISAGTVAIVAVASNSSLCGGFNGNVLREVKARINALKAQGCKVEVISVGKRVADPLRKAGYPSPEDWNELVAHSSYAGADELAKKLQKAFDTGKYDRIELIYNHFVSTATQKIVCETYLPMAPLNVGGGVSREWPDDLIIEPSPEEMLADLMPRVRSLRIYTVILDSLAAEHAARTVAMQTATDNGEDILQELTLEYNKGRQQKITSEILDLVGGSMQ